MNLRYLANIRVPTEKAHGIQIFSMCAALASVGVSVELVVPNRRSPLTDDPFVYYGVKQNFAVRRLSTGDVTWLQPYLGRFAFWLQTISFAIMALVDAYRHPAAVYYHRDEVTFLLFALFGLPSVWEMHRVPNHLWVYRRAMGQAKMLVVITQGIADALQEHGVRGDTVFVAPDGVDRERFTDVSPRDQIRARYGWGVDACVVLYTGQFYAWKGVDTVIAAAQNLPSNVHVVLVGGGGGRSEEMMQMNTALGGRVFFVGQVSPHLVPAYLAAADIVLIPNSAREEISRRYTSPLKVFEALAAGKAMIVSDLPSLREVLDDTCAVFVPADNAPALARAIADLAKDFDRRVALGAAAAVRSQSFTWTGRAARIVEQLAQRMS